MHSRTQVAVAAKIIYSSFGWMIGQETWNMSEEYFEEYREKEGVIKNTQLAEEILPYAISAMQIWFIGRIVLFFACFKWPQLIKISFYYEIITEWIAAVMPCNINSGRDIHIVVMHTAEITLLHYFEFLPTLIVACLTMIPVHVRRVVFYDDSVQ